MKEKVHKTNGAIWFNKMCPFNHLTPNYVKITIDAHNQECCNTKQAATTYRTNTKLEFFTRNIIKTLRVAYILIHISNPLF